jgi:DNA-binding response OmpR family regulator
MMSGAATLEDAVESLNQGADAFILKPVDPGELLNRLGTLTGFKRLERELRQARAEYNELFTIINEYSMA